MSSLTCRDPAALSRPVPGWGGKLFRGEESTQEVQDLIDNRDLDDRLRREHLALDVWDRGERDIAKIAIEANLSVRETECALWRLIRGRFLKKLEESDSFPEIREAMRGILKQLEVLYSMGEADPE